jgi:hypothetical protein
VRDGGGGDFSTGEFNFVVMKLDNPEKSIRERDRYQSMKFSFICSQLAVVQERPALKWGFCDTFPDWADRHFSQNGL